MHLINCHSHLLNFNFVPDRFFRSKAPIRERLFRRWWARRLVQAASSIFGWIPGVGYRRLHQALDLLNRDIEDVAAALLGEMSDCDPPIAMTMPLMMDLEIACGQEPEVPYPFQLLALSRLAYQYPGRVMPFVMVDPRRENAARLAAECLEHRGFLGVKLYPPLGYHPDPKSSANKETVNEQLHELYAFCSDHAVPMTVHCSRGGAYDQELFQAREACRECAFPSNWAPVLEAYPGLRLNLGHFGGDLLQKDEPSAWSGEILRMMNTHQNLFADVSYHSAGLRRRTRVRYFEILNALIDDKDGAASRRILFGTDWPMTRHTWREKDYVAAWVEGCDRARLQQIGFNNSMEFLFGGKGLPDRYTTFLSQHGRTPSDLPAWLSESLGLAVTARAALGCCPGE